MNTLFRGEQTMKGVLALALAATLLGGCGVVPSLPEAQARSAWKNRPVAEVIDYFGAPRQILGVPEKDWVVLVYGYDTSYVSREALGTSTGPQNGQVVHTEYWGDVFHSGSCELRIAINRARQVDFLTTRGNRCGSVDLVP
ncbi:hypothetical protein thsps21_01280 [Pseudomonas sp. No.21]|nr:hypothetical protein TUM20249_24440 [Pseudomonas tohonis]